ncbi:MAG: hypothetical protein ACOYVF_02700 [Candidatus Zixiibacteriota bacterium]
MFRGCVYVNTAVVFCRSNFTENEVSRNCLLAFVFSIIFGMVTLIISRLSVRQKS